MRRVSRFAANDRKRVGNEAGDGRKAVDGASRRSGQGEDQGRRPHARDRAREVRGREGFAGLGPHPLREPRHLDVENRANGFRRAVAGRNARSSRDDDEVQFLGAPAAQQDLDLFRLVRQNGRRRDFRAAQLVQGLSHGRASAILARPPRGSVRNGQHPGFHRGRLFGSEARNRPDRPPVFSRRRISPMTAPRSIAFTMS